MMKKSIFLAIFTAMALTACAQKNSVELRLNLEKGKTYIQTADVKMTMKMDMMGQKMDIDMPMSMTISMKVADIRDGNFVTEASYDAVKMSMNTMGQNMSFDTSDTTNIDPENPFAPVKQMFSSLIGKSFTMILDNRQNIVAIEGMDKLFASMFDSGVFSEEEQEQMNAMLQGMLGEEKMKENFSQGNIVFPEEAVSEGFTWTTETTQSVQGMEMQVKNTFTVEKIAKEEITISSVAQLAMGGEMIQNGIPVNVTMENSTMTGTYIIDLATGWSTSANINTAMKLTMGMNMGEESLAIPVEITIEMAVKDAEM